MGGLGGSVRVMGEWSMGQTISLILGVMNFQKMYGLFGLRHHIVLLRYE